MVLEAEKFILTFVPRHNKTFTTLIYSVFVTLFKDTRNMLLWTKAFIDEDEFLDLYDVNTSRNLLHLCEDCRGKFDLKEKDSTECKTQFRFAE